MVEVSQTGGDDPLQFDVRVQVGAGESRHKVTLARATLEQLGNGVEAVEFVRAAFEFLLEREPKEAIMSRFDVTVIGRYFPEFQEEIANYIR